MVRYLESQISRRDNEVASLRALLLTLTERVTHLEKSVGTRPSLGGARTGTVRGRGAWAGSPQRETTTSPGGGRGRRAPLVLRGEKGHEYSRRSATPQQSARSPPHDTTEAAPEIEADLILSFV